MNHCSLCGAAFACGQTDPQAAGSCWCMALPPAVPLPAAADGDAAVTAGCWCPACLHAHIASLAGKAPPSPA